MIHEHFARFSYMKTHATPHSVFIPAVPHKAAANVGSFYGDAEINFCCSWNYFLICHLAPEVDQLLSCAAQMSTKLSNKQPWPLWINWKTSMAIYLETRSSNLLKLTLILVDPKPLPSCKDLEAIWFILGLALYGH